MSDIWVWVVGGIGLVLAAIGWVVSPADFAFAWLAAVAGFAAWPLGSLALLLIHALIGGRWGAILQPALLGGVATMPVLVLAMLPLLLGLNTLYPWLHPTAPLPNCFYFNGPFFAGRAVFYVATWLTLAGVALRWPGSLARSAPAGLLLLAVTVTFASIDATESLDPSFNSSVYGMIAAAGMGLLALAIAVVITCAATPPDADGLTDLSRLVLGLVILWAYLAFMQALIVWESDLTVEIPWYLRRTTGGWGIVAGGLAIGHFGLPFLALLARGAQRRIRVIGGVAALLIAMGVVEAWWIVLPAHGFTWIAPAAALGLGGIGFGWFRWMRRHG